MARQRLSSTERRAQIAEATLRLLAERGARGLTAAALGAEVGLKDASLFKHFRDMGSIVAAAVDAFEAWLAESLDRPETEPLARLGGFFVHRQALLRARPEILRLAFNDRLVEAAAPADRDRVRVVLARSRALILDCLTAARAAGAVRADVPVDALKWTVMGAMRGAALHPDPPPPAAVWADVLTLITPQPGDAR